jgi:hypothetical protein
LPANRPIAGWKQLSASGALRSQKTELRTERNRELRKELKEALKEVLKEETLKSDDRR